MDIYVFLVGSELKQLGEEQNYENYIPLRLGPNSD